MKLADFFTLEGRKALRKMIFLGRFVEPDPDDRQRSVWRENYHYDENKLCGWIQNITIYPEALQKIFPSTSIFPCDLSKQKNEEKYLSFQKQFCAQECQAFLRDRLVLYQLRFVKNQIEVKMISILPMHFQSDIYVFPVGKRRRQPVAEQAGGLTERIDSFDFPAYPSCFGYPSVFYFGSQIYAVEQGFAVCLPIEDQAEQLVFKNDRVAVVQFRAGFLLYAAEDSAADMEEACSAVSVYQADARRLETDFFIQLQRNLQAEEIYVDVEDVLHLHASLKTQPFTLACGADAERVCAVYAQTTGAEMGESVFYLYPKTSWGNLYDLLLEQIPAHEFVFYQYPNLLTFLARANENPAQLFFCILLDLDLARPEHYLQQFLHILHGKKEMRVFHYKNIFQQLGSGIDRLPIGENLIFIGLPHASEVSYPLTAACLRKMSVVTLKQSKKFLQISETAEAAYDETAENLAISTSVYRTQWRRSVDPYSFFTKDELQFFDTVNELLADGFTYCQIQPQTLKHMADLIAGGFFSQEGACACDRGQWLDRCMRAFVIRKISGAWPSLQRLLGFSDGKKFQKGELLQLFESAYAKKISCFSYTIEAIKMKIRGYEDEGFFR